MVPLPSQNDPTGDKPDQRRNRRSHTKSRAGCKNCKKRRVKCDEAKPSCGNCCRFSMACDFCSTFEQIAQQQSAMALTPLKRPGRGRPRKNWISASAETTPRPKHASNATPPVVPITSETLSRLDEVELMHHWTLHTSTTFGETEIWREHIPPLSFSHSFLCHAVLAMAARHLSHQNPRDADRYIPLAERHYALAAKETAMLLPSLSSQNAQAIYATTILISFNSFAKGPAPGDLLVCADGDEVPWLDLLRGVRYVLQTVDRSDIFKGPFSIKSNILPANRKDPGNTSQPLYAWQQPIEDLSLMIKELNSPDVPMYNRSLEALLKCYQETYGSYHDPRTYSKGKFQDIMGWIFLMDTEFIQQIKLKKPIPLILLAYFAVLIKSLESFWFMAGWSTHLLREVQKGLSEEHHQWLEWPMLQILNSEPLV